jgi:hypothetical protein
MLGNNNNCHGDVKLCHLAMMQINKEKELGEEE